MKIRTWTIFGAGELIGDIFDAIESRGQQTKSIVLNMELDRKILGKIPSSIPITKLEDFRPTADYYFCGFINYNKRPLLECLQKYNLSFFNLIHKFSYVPRSVEMGQGNYIGAGVVLAANIQLGDFNFVNRAASIGHDTKISSYNHFGPGCTIAGNCRIGNRNCFYTRSSVINNLEIKDDIIIGAGGVVVDNILEAGTYVGVPSRKLQSGLDSMSTI